MKYIMILLMAIVFIGAGGAGGYFAFQKEAVASLGETNSKAYADKKARDKARILSAEETANLEFVKLDPIILPILDANGVSQVVTLIVSMEVNGTANAEYVTKMTPRLKDAFIQDMYGVLNRKASTEGGLIKVDQLKERLNKVSLTVLGQDKVNGVLLQVVNQRAI